LFDVSIKVVRFGNELASVGCRLLTRFLASRSVRNRGENGKLESAVISLSVKSMASWSYAPLLSHVRSQYESIKGGMDWPIYLRNTQILDGGNFVACVSRL